MPAKSKAQQRLMAIALHNPKKLRGKNRQILKSLSKKQLREFASTKARNLPARKVALKNLLKQGRRGRK